MEAQRASRIHTAAAAARALPGWYTGRLLICFAGQHCTHFGCKGLQFALPDRGKPNEGNGKKHLT